MSESKGVAGRIRQIWEKNRWALGREISDEARVQNPSIFWNFAKTIRYQVHLETQVRTWVQVGNLIHVDEKNL